MNSIDGHRCYRANRADETSDAWISICKHTIQESFVSKHRKSTDNVAKIYCDNATFHPNCLLLFSSPSPLPLPLLQVPFPSHSLLTPSSLLFPLQPYLSFSLLFACSIALVLTLVSPLTETISLLFSPYSRLPPFFSPLSHPISLLITASNSSQNLQ